MDHLTLMSPYDSNKTGVLKSKEAVDQTSRDRMIPLRSHTEMDSQISNHLITMKNEDSRGPFKRKKAKKPDSKTEHHKRVYTEALGETLLVQTAKKHASRILTFQRRNVENMKLVGSDQNKKKKDAGRDRVVDRNHSKWLDLPKFVDNFYYNLLDWSSDDVVAIGVNGSVYLYHPKNGRASKLTTLGYMKLPTSVQWSQDASALAVGDNEAKVKLWDISHTEAPMRTISGNHTQRVNALAWNGPLLTTGSKDSLIFLYDTRMEKALVSIYHNHILDVCALKWSYNGHYLASGGNDNLVNVWDKRKDNKAVYTFDNHKGAVKAVSWCPWQSGLLITGGGRVDGTVKFWNVSEGCMEFPMPIDVENETELPGSPNPGFGTGHLRSLLGVKRDVKVPSTAGPLMGSLSIGCQVCYILWSKNSREFVVSHGYVPDVYTSDDDNRREGKVSVWNYDSMTEIGELYGHTSRVLNMALSPTGDSVCTVSGDESLRFWDAFKGLRNDDELKRECPRMSASYGRTTSSRAKPDSLSCASPGSKVPISHSCTGDHRHSLIR